MKAASWPTDQFGATATCKQVMQQVAHITAHTVPLDQTSRDSANCSKLSCKAPSD